MTATTRSLVTTTAWRASALRRRLGAGMPPAARHQFFHAIPTQPQNGGIAVRDLFDVEYAADVLKRAKKQEQMMRRGIKWFSRGAKVVEWACYFCVSVTIAAAVRLSREDC